MKRIEVYLSQTAPLIVYYQEQGKLLEVDGTQDIAKVSDQLLKTLA